MGKRWIDISNRRFDDLIIQRRLGNCGDGSIKWECLCAKCNGINHRTSGDLRRGRTACMLCAEELSKKSPIKTLYGNYKRGALQRNHIFDLEFDLFEQIISQDCHYCSSSPKQKLKKEGSKHGVYYNGIDRIDNSVGYIISNVVSCCRFCNFAKGSKTAEELKEWLIHVNQLNLEEVFKRRYTTVISFNTLTKKTHYLF